MSLSLLFKAGALALACVGTASAKQQYTLDPADYYTGEGFWDLFTFETENDPTNGYVDYQSQAVAASTALGGQLIFTYPNGSNYMGVDYWNSYPVEQTATMRGRPSVRIESNKQYTYGLFVADLAHMPASICGTWPAFWTVSHVNYPSQGEIDILENINEQTTSLETLHTDEGCQVVGNQLGKQQSGTELTYNCWEDATSSNYGSQFPDQGCSASNTDPHSYGSTFNANGGGVYAMEWTEDVIQIWNFAPHNVPSNLASGMPDTSTWPEPVFTTAGGGCNIDDYFLDHSVVFDTTFCGDFAGQPAQWELTTCYINNQDLYPTCAAYVAANPSVYKDAYWIINSLKVYQKTDVVSSTSSTPSSTSTTSTTSQSSPTTTTPSSSTSSSSSSTTTSSSGITTSTPSSTPSTSTTSSTTSTTSTSTSTTGSSTTSSSAAPSLTSTPGGVFQQSSSSADPSSSSVAQSSSSTNSPPSSSYPSSSSAAPSSSRSSAVLSSSSTVPGSPTGSSSSSVHYGNSTSSAAGSSTTQYSTSTVYTTTIYTITSCAATVINCPAKIGQVTTETIELYTTICPVTAMETSTSPPPMTTSTVYTTSIYTITSCAPTVTNCPAKLGQVTTEIISLYTTVCPVTEATSAAGGVASSPVPSRPAYPIIPSSIIASSPITSPLVILKIETVNPVFSTPAAFSTIPKGSESNSTVPAGTASGAVKPSANPIYSASGASEIRVGGVLAMILAAAVALL